MRANRTVVLGGAIIAALTTLLVAGLTRAETPYPDYLLGATSTKVDYSVPVDVFSSVSSETAIGTARRFTASPGAEVRSVKLGLYSDLADKNVLVWVVDLDGLRIPTMGGPVRRDGRQQQAPAVFDRAVVFVSATIPEHVVGTLAATKR